MKKSIINWWEPRLEKNETKRLKDVIKNNFLSEGKLTKLLEKKIKSFLNVKYCILTSSGSAALYLSLKAINIKRGDNVIIPNITYVATANAVKLTGAIPILVDVDPRNLSIDINDLKKKITRSTKAIIPVYVSGRSGNIKKILAIAKKKNIKIIEDAAEAFGSKLNKKNLGTFGIAGCFSFTPTKIITTGQGGAVVSNNKKIINKIGSLKDQGRTSRKPGGDDEHGVDGFNFKFNDVLAAIGIGQIIKINEKIKKIKFINNFYKKNIKFVKKIEFIKNRKGEVPLWTEIKANDKNKLFQYLLKHKIYCRKIWRPISNNIGSFKKSKFKNSEMIYNTYMWLPSGFHLNKEKLKFICDKIKKYYSI